MSSLYASQSRKRKVDALVPSGLGPYQVSRSNPFPGIHHSTDFVLPYAASISFLYIFTIILRFNFCAGVSNPYISSASFSSSNPQSPKIQGEELTFCGVHSESVNTTPSIISNPANPAFLPVPCKSFNNNPFTFSSCINASWDFSTMPFALASWRSNCLVGITIAMGFARSAAAKTQTLVTMFAERYTDSNYILCQRFTPPSCMTRKGILSTYFFQGNIFSIQRLN